MCDFMGIKFAGRQGIFAAGEVNLSAEKKLGSKLFCGQMEQLQLTAFVGSSASMLNVTAPQWHDAKLKLRRRLADLVLGDPTNIIR
jgi:hypothetical protein